MGSTKVANEILGRQVRLGTRWNNLVNALANMCMGSAGLAEGTNSGTFQTARAVSYMIDGQMYYKAATDNIAFTANGIQADSKYRRYLVLIDSSGTVSTVAGTAADTAAAAKWPAVTADRAVLGGVLIRTNGAAFTPGTTDLSAAGITDTWYDFGILPMDDSGVHEGVQFVESMD